ncbi:DUF2147 domain-containing protein [Caenorhabditis elegans]|uniref:DUF2147 domain-containing protein n=1 Tax=Caenorhabditis elegans TaxID=6239 RepID=A5Z2S2_CAEEL|nr:DUF2147 domain-containing protein [Caenorhabditis elegans]CAN99695.1 DUF2147 domain-containing protein [Caenorhabditis elegans]|eukprot:NP_001122608.1 Uncharacterized protein CELE_F27E5.7 [Caenorhabditis elegans]
MSRISRISILFISTFASLVGFSIPFSDFRLPENTVVCSILQDTKCEWKQNWKNAEGVRRELDAGKPPIQLFYFCKENRTETCGIWLDENEKPIEDAPTTDRLSGEAFIIEKMGLHVLGDYMKFPEEKGDKKLIIE